MLRALWGSLLSLGRCALLGRGPLLSRGRRSPLGLLHVQGRAGRGGLGPQRLAHVMGPAAAQAAARTALKIGV